MKDNKISRRTALKQIVAGGAGVVAGTSLLGSCKNDKTVKKTYSKVEKTSDTIVTRTWETTSETIGLLGLGCMRLPRMGEDRNSPIDQEQTNEMVDYSLAHGINYFDTAPAYPGSEVAMGVALCRHPRESYKLATKMSNFPRGPQQPTLEDAKQMFETSLSNLKTDYFDYFLLHSLSGEQNYLSRFVENGVLDYIINQKKAGRIRHIGFSFHGSNEELEKLLDRPEYDWEFVQLQINYLDWKDMPDRDPRSKAKIDAETQYNSVASRNIPVVVMEPVRGGALATVNSGIEDMFIQSRPDLSPAGMALSFVGSLPGVMVVLSGMSNMDQLVENVNTFTDFIPLSDETNEMLFSAADLYKSNPMVGCTACAYCMPCPSGVNIPGVFAVYDRTSSELNLPDPDGVIDEEYKRKRKIFLNRYNKTLKKTEKASSCTQCETCLPKCPQSIRITQQIQKIDELVRKLNEIK